MATTPLLYPVDAAGSIVINGPIYDDTGRLIESEDASFEYDARGNLTRKTDKSTKAYTLYSWNGEDQLVQVQVQVQVQRFADDVAALPTTDIVYTYDSLGRRSSRTKDGVTERFVYDGNDHIATLTADGTAAATYTFGPGIDSPLSGDFSGARRYFHADHLGSIVALTDDTAVTDSYRYGPFGENLGTAGSTSNPFRYTAREYESDDLYYYRNRYYDPTLQRFLSEDRQGFAGGDHNLYRYVGNNPANFTDPSGNWAFLIPAIWAGVEAGLSLYDAYDAYRTVTDPCLGLGDKLTAGGLLAAGMFLPGGGYSKADDVLDGAMKGRNLPFKDSDRLTKIKETLDAIESGGPFPHKKDGTVFKNKERILPDGNYREYTVDTPGAHNRGARRVVQDIDTGKTYYTDDHDNTFIEMDPKRY